MSTPLLAVAYALVAALLLNVWIATKWRTAFKVGLVVVVSLLYVGTYIGIREIEGRPTEEPLPESFRLLWAKIDEPNKVTGAAGHIYLWVQKLDVTDSIAGGPRAHRLPYRLDLAEEVEDALTRMEGGTPLNGRMTRGMIDPDAEVEAPEQQATSEGDSDISGPDDDRIFVEFVELPRTSLPPKTL
ncbi:MAG: hypothetical protein CL389_13130 [Acidiferrobacteraceae bacterium]|jgi:hypothetical protein|nr:hypothetical protein [Acidiferrobacteraceae bacterium]|tara:strand:+ start:133 stop:690 length:558 start_codon:yes stop_codon:yes gene_type:complete